MFGSFRKKILFVVVMAVVGFVLLLPLLAMNSHALIIPYANSLPSSPSGATSSNVSTFEYLYENTASYLDPTQMYTYISPATDYVYGFTLIASRSGYVNFLAKASSTKMCVFVSPSNEENVLGFDYFNDVYTWRTCYTPVVSDYASSSLDLYSLPVFSGLKYLIHAGGTNPSIFDFVSSWIIGVFNFDNNPVAPLPFVNSFVLRQAQQNLPIITASSATRYAFFATNRYQMSSSVKPFMFYTDVSLSGGNVATYFATSYLKNNQINYFSDLSYFFESYEYNFPSLEGIIPLATSSLPLYASSSVSDIMGTYQIPYNECIVSDWTDFFSNFTSCVVNPFIWVYNVLFAPFDFVNPDYFFNETKFDKKFPFSITTLLPKFYNEIQSVKTEYENSASSTSLAYTTKVFGSTTTIFTLDPICSYSYLTNVCSLVNPLIVIGLYSSVVYYAYRRFKDFKS